MVKIRLKRMGAKKHPFYRIVVADGRYPRNGKFIEEIGTYDPLQNPPLIHIDLEKVHAWMKNGAQPTDTVRSIIAQAEGGFKKPKKTAKAVVKETPKAVTESPTDEDSKELAEKPIAETSKELAAESTAETAKENVVENTTEEVADA